MISDSIHVAYSELLDLEIGSNIEDLNGSLSAAARGATAIDVLGGYYTVEPIVDFLASVRRKDRASCRVRIAVGLDASPLMTKTWGDMRRLEEALQKAGFLDVRTYIVAGNPHFHTKLFHFLRRTSHSWFVGSANPGSTRHELMVNFRGKHRALSRYMGAVFDEARRVTPSLPAHSRPTTLEEFFLTGVLLHKPPRKSPFTFEAFRLEPEDRAKMMQALTTGVVPHARPRTQGFGFGLRSAVGTSDTSQTDGTAQDETARIQMRQYAVDTVLGSWAPRVYADEIAVQLLENETNRLRELTDFAKGLSDAGEAKVRAAFSDYATAMTRLLTSNGIEVRPIDNLEMAFDAFLRSRQRMLKDGETLRRLSRRLQITDMPNIWGDDNAVRSFESSFFDDVAFRMSQSHSPRVVRSIKMGIGDVGDGYVLPTYLRKALKKRLRRMAWEDDEWIVPERR